MKKVLVLSIGLALFLSVSGQNENSTCFALRVANKKYISDTLLLQPKLYLQGFYVLANGVYDFRINNKVSYYQRVFKVTKDSIYAGYVFDTIPTLNFSLNDNFSILLYQCYNGRCGFPNYSKITNKKYQFKIVQTDIFCWLHPIKVTNEDANIDYLGFQYLTGSGLLPIFRKDGRDYVIEGSVTQRIK